MNWEWRPSGGCMRCPKCERAEYDAAAPCPGCGFSADPALIEALSHVDWVLDEIDAWRKKLLES